MVKSHQCQQGPFPQANKFNKKRQSRLKFQCVLEIAQSLCKTALIMLHCFLIAFR